MPGKRPEFSLRARRKDRGGQQAGPSKAIDIAAAWAKEKGYGYNLRLGPGVQLLINGQPITDGKDGDFWLDLYDNRVSEKDQDPQTGTPRPRSTYGLHGGGPAKHTTPPEKEPPDDDIPF